jgi:TonB family protein
MIAHALVAVMFVGEMQSQPPKPTPKPATSACSRALAGGTGPSVAELCLGEEQETKSRSAKEGADRERLQRAAAEHYLKAAGLASATDPKVDALDALARVYGPESLDDYGQLEPVLREIIDLRPGELEPVLRLAKAQEDAKFFDAAEETLLTVRRQRPDQSDVFKALAQFYARRATAAHTAETVTERQPTSAPGEPDEHGIYQVGGGLKPPSRLDVAVYPPEAMAAGIKGGVQAEVLIDPTGNVIDAKVLQSIPMLDEAALQAVRNWRFQPTLVNGQPVPVRMVVTVNFTLNR